MGMYIEELRNMLCDELDQIAQKGELTAGSLETIDKLTHSIKSIDAIMAMEDSGYSRTGSYEGSYRGGSYARDGRGRSSARGQKRDSMGRYSRASYPRTGYSRGDGKEEMMEKLESMMHEIQNMED